MRVRLAPRARALLFCRRRLGARRVSLGGGDGGSVFVFARVFAHLGRRLGRRPRVPRLEFRGEFQRGHRARALARRRDVETHLDDGSNRVRVETRVDVVVERLVVVARRVVRRGVRRRPRRRHRHERQRVGLRGRVAVFDGVRVLREVGHRPGRDPQLQAAAGGQDAAVGHDVHLFVSHRPHPEPRRVRRARVPSPQRRAREDPALLPVRHRAAQQRARESLQTEALRGVVDAFRVDDTARAPRNERIGNLGLAVSSRLARVPTRLRQRVALRVAVTSLVRRGRANVSTRLGARGRRRGGRSDRDVQDDGRDVAPISSRKGGLVGGVRRVRRGVAQRRCAHGLFLLQHRLLLPGREETHLPRGKEPHRARSTTTTPRPRQ